MMEAELTEQTGYEKSESGEKAASSRRNGKTSKTPRADQGPMEIEVPRDRDSGHGPLYVPYKDRRAVAADAALASLEKFSEKWDRKYPAISRFWRSRWNGVIPFMKFSPGIRGTVYTASAVGPINCALQRNLKTRQSFPNDEAAMKLIFMILRRISKKWTMPIRNWGGALHQFALIYGDRVPL